MILYDKKKAMVLTMAFCPSFPLKAINYVIILLHL
jgi:hypothetical protein